MTYDDLLGQIEAIPLPEGDLDAIVRGLAERAALVNALVDVDPTGLLPADRARIGARLRAVLARDAALVRALEDRKLGLTGALDHVARGRNTARGYRTAEPTVDRRKA